MSANPQVFEGSQTALTTVGGRARMAAGGAALKGNIAIYRVPIAGIAEVNGVLPLAETATGTERIEIEGTADTPDGRTKIAMMQVMDGRFRTDNPVPFGEQTTKPDTGFSGARITFDLIFDESSGNAAGAIATLRRWFRERNTSRGVYAHGRIGLRNDYRPEYNLVPSLLEGYKLLNFELTQEMIRNPFPTGRLMLEYSGVPTLDGSPGTGTGGNGNGNGGSTVVPTQDLVGFTETGTAAGGAITYTSTAGGAASITRTFNLTTDLALNLSLGDFEPSSIRLNLTINNATNDRHRLRVHVRSNSALDQINLLTTSVNPRTSNLRLDNTYNRQSDGSYATG